MIAKSKAEIAKLQAEINKIAAQIGLTEKEIKFYVGTLFLRVYLI